MAPKRLPFVVASPYQKAHIDRMHLFGSHMLGRVGIALDCMPRVSKSRPNERKSRQGLSILSIRPQEPPGGCRAPVRRGQLVLGYKGALVGSDPGSQERGGDQLTTARGCFEGLRGCHHGTVVFLESERVVLSENLSLLACERAWREVQGVRPGHRQWGVAYSWVMADTGWWY